MDAISQGRGRPHGHDMFHAPSQPSLLDAGVWPSSLCPLSLHADTVPGVQAVLPAEGVLYGQPPVVEFQSRETAFIQTQHLPVAERA